MSTLVHCTMYRYISMMIIVMHRVISKFNREFYNLPDKSSINYNMQYNA